MATTWKPNTQVENSAKCKLRLILESEKIVRTFWQFVLESKLPKKLLFPNKIKAVFIFQCCMILSNVSKWSMVERKWSLLNYSALHSIEPSMDGWFVWAKWHISAICVMLHWLFNSLISFSNIFLKTYLKIVFKNLK